MYRIALPIALALILAGPTGFAQQSAPQPAPTAQATPDAQSAPEMAPVRSGNPHKQAQRLGVELNLTPDQTAKVEPILAQRDQKIAALRANTSIQPFIAKAQMRAIQKDTADQLSTVLTPAQMEQLRSMRQAHAPKNQQPPAAPPAA